MKHWSIEFRGRIRPIKRGGRSLPKGKGSFLIRAARLTYRVDFRPFLGMWLAALGPARVVGSAMYSISHAWKPPVKKKLPKTAGEGNQKHLAPIETNTFRDLLPLVEHCCCRQYEDGDPRETGWFTISTIGAAWRVQVKDPDSSMSFAAVGPTLDKALELAALLLGCDEAPWELDQWLLKARKKK